MTGTELITVDEQPPKNNHYLHVHYVSKTGQIEAWETSSIPTTMKNHETISILVDDIFIPNPNTQKVINGQIVDKTPDEKADALQPTLYELQSRIYLELCTTDHWMMPDRPNSKRDEWVIYRQALRDLSKLATPSDMINSWPVHPDGDEPIKELRERLAASMMLRKSES